MTGFGKAQCELPDKKLTIEIKTLNSKQVDTNMRLPSLYKEKELEVRQLISSKLERGKIDCSFYYELVSKGSSAVINKPVVKSYYDQLYQIAEELGLKTSEETLAAVMKFPDTMVSEKPELQEQEWNMVKKSLMEALEEVDRFRSQEGEILELDSRERVASILAKLKQIEQYEQERIKKIRERIGNSLTEFLGKDTVDENRLEQEIIYYLEKIDITEEKVRLLNHCNYFSETLADEGQAGKKLGFITQEMGREINTLGSKANHSEIQKLVVEMKDELEKIKEQVLNIL